MGTERRGVASEVVVRCPAGHALVVRCHPLREGSRGTEPFPTLYWLVCDAVAAQIGRLESAGGVAEVERRIAGDAALRARVRADHDAYAAERWSLLTAAERARVEEAGLTAACRDRGIGGVANRDAVKCLHLHYAHHLARGSAIGAEIESLGAPRLCPSTDAD